MASAELETFVDGTISVACKHGYYPTTFIRMREQLGTVPAIIKLVETGHVQSGLKRLKTLGLLDHSIEAAVLRFPGEFPQRAQQCAVFRLQTA